MGDRDTISWALKPTNVPIDRRWIPVYVLAISPLPEADRAAVAILKGRDDAAQEWLVQGYAQSRSEMRVQRLKEAFQRHPGNRSLWTWVRRSLTELAAEGDAAAAEALTSLPPTEER